MTPLQALKKVRRGLTNPENFDAHSPAEHRPHCTIGEWEMVTRGELGDLFHTGFFFRAERKAMLGFSNFTHRRALQILDRAIKRQEKLG